MRHHKKFRSLPYLRLTLAASALAVASTLGQTAFAATAPKLPAPLARPESNLRIVGTPAVRWSGASGSFHVDRVENHYSSVTERLTLEVALTSTYPTFSTPDPGWPAIAGYVFCDVVFLDPLPPGASHSNIDSGPVGFVGRQVPVGEFWMLVILGQEVAGGWDWRIEDYVVMSDKVTCDGASCTVVSPCSNAGVAGDWGYTKTGTLFAPTGATPFATLGILKLGRDGTLAGVNTGAVGGKVSADVLKGTFEVKPDCTGTTTVEVYDQSGALLRTIGMNLVVDDDANHLRGIMTSLVLPNGVSLPTVITADAKRLSSKGASGN
jgi:hypothetical protein